jgi:hypothetical protein
MKFVSKRYIIITLIIMSVMISFSCTKEDDNEVITEEIHSLPESVTRIVSDERLNDFRDLGITINEGKTPPNIEGSYRVSPFKKKNANFEDSYNEVLDYTYTFSEQDSKALTVLVEEVNNDANTTGSGTGTVEAAISGSGNAFSVFVKIHTDYGDGAQSDMISVISGELTDEGIQNFQYATIMDNNYGNAKKYLMDEGQGRLWEDEDVYSPNLFKKVSGKFQYTGTTFKYPESATVHEDETFDVVYKDGGYDEETYETVFSYQDDYFDLPATNNYNHELATMSFRLAMAAFGLNKDESGTEIGWPTTNYGTRTSNIRTLLGRQKDDSGYGCMGFKDVMPMGYDHQPYNDKSIAATFAHKSINGSEVIVIAVRGGLYEAEWGDNFRVGTGNEHEGFKNARDIVIGFLNTYLSTIKISTSRKLKFWITGFSRGAATANMVAAKLTKDKKISSYNISQDDIYAYCFATPRNTIGATSSGFENIFNIINPTDAVPHFPFGGDAEWLKKLSDTQNWGFERYGINKFLAGPNDNARHSNMLSKLNSLNNPFNKDTYCIDKFRLHNGNLNLGLKRLYDAGDNSKTWNVQDYLENPYGLIDMLHSVFGTMGGHTPKEYVDNYQDSAIIGASEFENGKVKGFLGILGGITKKDEAAVGVNFRSTAATLGLQGLVFYNYDTDGNWPGSDSGNFETQQEANEQCLEAQRNALAVSQGHFPELYLAWMMSGEANCFK